MEINLPMKTLIILWFLQGGEEKCFTRRKEKRC